MLTNLLGRKHHGGSTSSAQCARLTTCMLNSYSPPLLDPSSAAAPHKNSGGGGGESPTARSSSHSATVGRYLTAYAHGKEAGRGSDGGRKKKGIPTGGSRLNSRSKFSINSSSSNLLLLGVAEGEEEIHAGSGGSKYAIHPLDYLSTELALPVALSSVSGLGSRRRRTFEGDEKEENIIAAGDKNESVEVREVLEMQDPLVMLLADHAFSAKYLGMCFLDARGYLTGYEHLLGVATRDVAPPTPPRLRLPLRSPGNHSLTTHISPENQHRRLLNALSLNKVLELLATIAVADLHAGETQWRRHLAQSTLPSTPQSTTRSSSSRFQQQNFVFFVAAVFGVYSGLVPLTHENPLMHSLPPLLRRRFTDVTSAVAAAGVSRFRAASFSASSSSAYLPGVTGGGRGGKAAAPGESSQLEHPMFLTGIASQVAVEESTRWGEWQLSRSTSTIGPSQGQIGSGSLSTSTARVPNNIHRNTIKDNSGGKEAFTMLDYPQSSGAVTLPFRWQAFAFLHQAAAASSIRTQDDVRGQESRDKKRSSIGSAQEPEVMFEADADGNPVPITVDDSASMEGKRRMMKNSTQLPVSWLPIIPTENMVKKVLQGKDSAVDTLDDDAANATTVTSLHGLRLGITARSLLHTPVTKEARYNFSNKNEGGVLTKFALSTISRHEALRGLLSRKGAAQQGGGGVEGYFSKMVPQSPMRTYHLSLTLASYIRLGRLPEALHFFCHEIPTVEQEWFIPTVVLEGLVGKIVQHYTSHEHQMWLQVHYGGTDAWLTEKSAHHAIMTTPSSMGGSNVGNESGAQKIKSQHRLSLQQLLLCRARIMTVVEQRLAKAFHLQLPSVSSVSSGSSTSSEYSSSSSSARRGTEGGIGINASLLPTAKLFVDLLGEKVHELGKSPLANQASAEASMLALLRRFPAKTFHELLQHHQHTIPATLASFFTHMSAAVNHFVLVPTTPTTSTSTHCDGGGAHEHSSAADSLEPEHTSSDSSGGGGRRTRGSTEQLLVTVLLPYLEYLLEATPQGQLPHREISVLIDSLLTVGAVDISLVLFAYVGHYGKLDLSAYDCALLSSLQNAFKCCQASLPSPLKQQEEGSGAHRYADSKELLPLAAITGRIIAASSDSYHSSSTMRNKRDGGGPKLSYLHLKALKERRLATFGPDPPHKRVEGVDIGEEWHCLRNYLVEQRHSPRGSGGAPSLTPPPPPRWEPTLPWMEKENPDFFLHNRTVLQRLGRHCMGCLPARVAEVHRRHLRLLRYR